MSDSDIENRLQSLPEEQILGTHFTEKHMKRRLKNYRENMDESTGDLILKDFFKENKISIFEVNISSQTEAILESIISPQAIDEAKEADNIQAQLKRQD